MFTANITLGGLVRTVNFNNYCLEAIGKLYGLDTLEARQELEKTYGESYMTFCSDILYGGLVGHCRRERLKVDFTIQEVSDWMESSTNEEIAEIVRLFLASQKERIIVEQPAIKKKMTE